MAEQWKVPFDRQGNQIEFGGYNGRGSDWCPGFEYIDFRDNEEFQDTLVYEGYQRGRSAAFFLWRRSLTGTTVTMFMSEMDRLLREGKIGRRRLSDLSSEVCVAAGRWHFIKRGANYSVSLVEEVHDGA